MRTVLLLLGALAEGRTWLSQTKQKPKQARHAPPPAAAAAAAGADARAAATAANLVKCQLEMGSKNALIVAADADLDVAVNAAFVGAYSGTGQKCTASSRLIVDESVHDAFVEKLQAKLASVTVGHALEEGVDIGPVASEVQLNENLAWIERGVKEGATLLCGGERLDMPTPGYYLSLIHI